MMTPTKDYFKYYFNKNIFIIKACGLWIPLKSESNCQKWMHYTYTILISIYLYLLYQPSESGVMFVNPNLDKFLRALRDQFNHFGSIYKVYIWYRYRKVILYVIGVLKDTKFNYDAYGYFDIENIVEKNRKEAHRWMILFLGFITSICCTMLLSTLYFFFMQGNEQWAKDEDGRDIYAQQLPVNLITPFNQLTRAGFISHFFFEIFPLEIHAWIIAGADGLFATLLSCVSAHLDILKEAFRTIRPRCMIRLNMPVEDHLHDSQLLVNEMQREMTKCVKHLQMIYDVSEKLENIYFIQTAFQVIISLFEMCFCLYILSDSLNENAGPELMYLVSTSFQLLLYCWFGNSITESSNMLTDGIFEGDWLSASRSFKTSMMITMTRLRRPIHITIGKFSPLMYTTFLSIARVAYSFFTVLKSESLD